MTSVQGCHAKLIEEFTTLLRDAGYKVNLEQVAGNKRVDLYAEKDSFKFTLEVVNTHYSGPLSQNDVTELLVRITKPPQSNLEGCTNVVVKDFDDKLWGEFRSIALKKNLSVKEALALAVEGWCMNSGSKPS